MAPEIALPLPLLNAVIQDARTLGVATYDAELGPLLGGGRLAAIVTVLVRAGLEVRLRVPPAAAAEFPSAEHLGGIAVVADSTVRANRLRFVLRPVSTQPRRPPRTRRGGGGRRPAQGA
ncbi:MAG: hypothetical protein AB7P02_19045 [Alphaproteobacteria bacterium]